MPKQESGGRKALPDPASGVHLAVRAVVDVALRELAATLQNSRATDSNILASSSDSNGPQAMRTPSTWLFEIR